MQYETFVVCCRCLLASWLALRILRAGRPTSTCIGHNGRQSKSKNLFVKLDALFNKQCTHTKNCMELRVQWTPCVRACAFSTINFHPSFARCKSHYARQFTRFHFCPQLQQPHTHYRSLTLSFLCLSVPLFFISLKLMI